jgi:heme-degrading monooxygenase HmoA
MESYNLFDIVIHSGHICLRCEYIHFGRSFETTHYWLDESDIKKWIKSEFRKATKDSNVTAVVRNSETLGLRANASFEAQLLASYRKLKEIFDLEV